MRATATGAVRITGAPRTFNPSRNFAVQSTTASPTPIASDSRASHVRPTLVKAASTKTSDYLIVVALIVALLIMLRKG
jgi:hypothetical protein